MITKTWKELWKEWKNSPENLGWDKEFYSWVSKKYPKLNIK